MSYQPRSPIKSLGLPLVIVLGVAIMYWAFSTNSLLFANNSLQSSLIKREDLSALPIPKPKADVNRSSIRAILTGPQVTEDHTPLLEQSRAYPKYRRISIGSPLSDPKEVDFVHWLQGPQFNYALVNGRKLVSVDHELKPRWTFQLCDCEPENLFTGRPLVTDKFVYIATEAGKLYSLHRETGRMNWVLPLGEKVIFSPLLVGSDLYLMTQPMNKEMTALLQVDGHTGDIKWRSPWSKSLATAGLSYHSHHNIVFMVLGERIIAYSTLERQPMWSFNATGAIHHSPLLVGNHIYFATETGQAVALLARNGRKIWEVNLEDAAVSSFAFVPEYKIITIMSKNTHLHALNIKNGELEWKFLTGNESHLKSPKAVRMNNTGITKLGLKWKYKGWSIWSPCGKNHLCIFRPENGQLLSRIYLHGNPTDSPHFHKDSSTFYISLTDMEPSPFVAEEKDSDFPNWSLGVFEKNINSARKSDPNETKDDSKGANSPPKAHNQRKAS